ncbi:Golgi integral membrane protein 4 isoform X2 [Choloepus didactylus]|uniref:Golgi integral membrane protein 4 isoform X2 n=1 Tax=Choloepus didactylus TaxID=27675 RepID=UPI0018A09878|nr:Golgi integral membrane protein 4 isoform X2 [Choloepus didactylus]
MGNGMCSRKQKRIFQTLLLLTVVFGFLYGAMLYYELQTQLRKAEAVALKYQQHQESLSAQLQVVYEHRSRLEKSLQKERLEHKKAKEDFLVYKLEAQETLNKGRQDSNSRYSALNVQHQMLKSQHEELKKQHSDLEEEHRKQGEDFSRTFNDHKQKYLQLQQEKEQELYKLKESIYNLREENRQLRKAHQDMHTQLQDVKQQHKNLLSEHEQLVVTLEDHKSALAAAQTQVAEYKQLKDTLNRIPSFRKPEPAEAQNVTQVAHSPQGYSTAREKLSEEPPEVSRNNHVWQNHEAIPGGTEEAKPSPPTKKEAEFQAPARLGPRGAEPREADVRQAEEEHRKALEEEEMEQVGQAERLEEEHDPSPEEQDREWKEQRGQKEAANLLEGDAHARVYPSVKPSSKLQSPYEEQLEQQKLAVRHAEEAQRLREHQEALLQQRLQGHLLRQQQQQQQQQLGTRELPRQRQAEREEGQLQHQEQPRQQARYDAMDNDIVQGAEDQGIQEEEGAYERDNQHQDEAEDPGNGHEPQEQGPQEADPESEADRAAVEDINPADDPNNQGEDEFEEAEQVREENLPDENEEQKQSNQKQENAEMEEHLVMAGNPDQQEDNVDEQYQEEGEEEVQEDLTEEKKRELEHNAEEAYGENDENVNDKTTDGEEQEIRDENRPKGREEHYEEDEEEEEDKAAAAEKSHRRAEM